MVKSTPVIVIKKHGLKLTKNNFIYTKKIKMEEKVIFENDFMTYYLGENYIFSFNKQFSNDEQYRVNLTEMINQVQQQKVTNIIFDAKNFKGTSPANQKWVMEHFVPEVVKAGVRKIALIFPKDAFGQFALKNYIKSAAKDMVEPDMFENKEEAVAWVCS